MRVVGGEYGGRRLEAPRGRATRPTSERTREAVFSMLGDINGARVLDLFAGSGALGIEALSRGAAHATFVDRARPAIAAITRNLEQLGLRERAQITQLDVRVLEPHSASYDLVFVDPPYGEATDLGPLLERELPAQLAPGGRVVSESDRRAPLELGLPTIRERRYGDTLIRIHQLANA
ncbi:MAG: 16S rRNA (guanine(966)-N(2))-methyltransferase RsmD [Solirubrobacteraceae bacterium]|jgi:16S rRNA (guanine966-N2)-methyltransferase